MKNKALERFQYYSKLTLLPAYVASFCRNVRKNPRELAKLQEKKLKLIIRHAYDYNPFYHRLYRDKRVSPYDIKTLEDFGKKVVTAVKKGKGEADKATRVAQLRIEIGSLNRQMGDLFRDLGELFYKNYNKASKAGQEELVETVTHIAAVEKSIASLKREIKSVKGGKALPQKTRGR